MQPAGNVTMKAVAAAAGVTQATVSMALAGNPRIPATTRDRIKAIADQLGYRANPYVSALMRTRRQGKPHAGQPVVALVNAFERADSWRKHRAPTIHQMREGAIERATLRGYRAEEFWLRRDGMTDERFSEMLHARGIQGLLLSPLADGMPLPKFTWDYFAAVGLNVPHSSVTMMTVCNDHYFSALQAARECFRRGYRRPALVMRNIHRHRLHGRWDAGFLVSKILLAGMEPVDPLCFDEWPTPKEFVRWLKRHRVDAVITPLADTVLKHLQEAGLRVPEDIGVAWISCSNLGHPISGIYQNGTLIGATAMDALIAMIERNERGLTSQAMTQMIEGLWNEGTTLRPLPS